MTYYNREGNVLELKKDNMDFLNSGSFGQVLHNSDLIFKEYYHWTGKDFRLTPKMFDILKQVNNKHFIELFDIYSNFNPLDLVMLKLGIKKFIIDAYTAKYYPDNSVNALYEKIDYILDNFREIEKLFDEFANNKIYTSDIKRKNCILGNNNIVIIDPDSFFRSNSHKDIIKICNKRNLLYLFKDICTSGADNISDEELITYKQKIIDSIFKIHIDVTANTDVTHEISKELRYSKRPIDHFMK